jgi:hypothetical protein
VRISKQPYRYSNTEENIRAYDLKIKQRQKEEILNSVNYRFFNAMTTFTAFLNQILSKK